MKQTYTIELTCPWCGKGKVQADKSTETNLSCQCANCGRYYTGDLKTGRAKRAKPSHQFRRISLETITQDIMKKASLF